MNYLRKLSWFRREVRSCHPGILCEQLEERIVLDAAAVGSDQTKTADAQALPSQQVDVTTAPNVGQPVADHAAAAQQTPDSLAKVFATDLNVAIVSQALDQIEGISSATKDGTTILYVDPNADNLSTVNQQLHDLVEQSGQKIHTLAILSHGSEGLLTIGSDQISMFTLGNYTSGLQELSGYLGQDAQIQLYGCSIAGDDLGKTFVSTVASYTGAHVFASTDVTGGESKDWTLEYSSDSTVVISPIVDSTKAAEVSVSLPATYPAYDSNWGKSMSGAMYYVSDDGVHGKELWRSDGTAAGTYMVMDINPGSVGSDPTELVVSNGVLYFSASDGASADGTELWRTDGTAAGTYMVKDINPGNQSSSPAHLTDVNGVLYFSASDGASVSGTELWCTDGTAAGTYMVKDIYPGNVSGNPDHLVNVNGTLFFSASDGSNGTELWRSDGTAGGTSMVADINVGGGSSDPDHLVNVNGTVFFSASDGASNHGTELWSSDGTAAGSSMVADINVGTGSSDPDHLVNVNGTLFFSASDGPSNHGTELWSSDGTAAGSSMVADIKPGNGSSDPAYILNVNGVAFFAADDGVHGSELWKSDGTEAGTAMVKDAAPGAAGSDPMFLNNYNGAVLYVADDGTHGYELWRSDGTKAGTALMKDIDPSGSSFPLNFARLNPLFFLADDGMGFKLWKTDGTVSGTVKVSEVHPPADGSPLFAGGTAGSDMDVVAKSFRDSRGNSLLDIIESARSRPDDVAGTHGTDLPAAPVKDSDIKIKNVSSSDSLKGLLGNDVEDAGDGAIHHAAGKHAKTSDSDAKRHSADTADHASAAKVSDRPVPGTIKVVVLNNGDYSVHADTFALVVNHGLWIPPIVKWYLGAVSEGRYRPGALPHGYEEMIWDYLRYSSNRQKDTDTPLGDLELRLAWQWAEWRRHAVKDHGSDETLPWSFFKGLSEAMILFYGQGAKGKVDFSGAVKALHHNASNLSIIPVKLPEDAAHLESKEARPK